MPPKRVPAKAAPKTVGNNKKSIATPKKSGTSVTTTKKSSNPTTKSTQKEQKLKKGPTPEDLAAIKIQSFARGFLSRKKLKLLKKEKKEYEETIEKIQREAFVAMVKAEQEAAERELAKEEEERRRKKEELKRKKRILEAAFDGDVDEMENILKEVDNIDNEKGVSTDDIGRITRRIHQMAVVECRDANENTPLSEAASGGNVDAITFLIQRGADPNSIGAWGRTPLYRAAFSGHMEAVECLLQHGADPRIYADDSNTPEQVASIPQIIDTLQNWDISVTESISTKMEAEKERKKEELMKKKEAETNKLQNELSEIQKVYEMKQRVFEKCYCELEKRIHEHDSAESKGFEKPEVTLGAIKDAEVDLEIAKLNAMQAREALEQAKLKLREQQHDDSEELPGMKCNIRELDEVLMRDVGNRIRDSGKWPLMIDPTGQASTFLRYRDTNYLCALNPKHMNEEVIRLAILGAIRYGKPLVVDMLEVDMFPTITDVVDRIQGGLMEKIMNKEILKQENYMSLVKSTDANDYQSSKFQHHRVDSFLLVIVTKNKFPPEYLLEQTYPIRIVLPNT